MAAIQLAPNVPQAILNGTTSGVIMANGGSSPISLNTTDPSVDGPAITLKADDSVVMEPGSVWAAAPWYAVSNSRTTLILTLV